MEEKRGMAERMAWLEAENKRLEEENKKLARELDYYYLKATGSRRGENPEPEYDD